MTLQCSVLSRPWRKADLERRVARLDGVREVRVDNQVSGRERHREGAGRQGLNRAEARAGGRPARAAYPGAGLRSVRVLEPALRSLADEARLRRDGIDEAFVVRFVTRLVSPSRQGVPLGMRNKSLACSHLGSQTVLPSLAGMLGSEAAHGAIDRRSGHCNPAPRAPRWLNRVLRTRGNFSRPPVVQSG